MPTYDLELTVARRDKAATAALRMELPNQTIDLVDPTPVELDGDTLRQLTSYPELYGQLLTSSLFVPALREGWRRALDYAEGGAAGLRLRLRLDGDDGLHSLRWELLRDPLEPRAGRPLAHNERVTLSRFLSAGLGALPLAPAGDARPVVAVASPPQLGAYGLEPFDVAAAVARARRDLGAPEPHVLDGAAGRPAATLAAIVEALRDGPAILQIVCHGALDQERAPLLFLEREGELYTPVTGDELLHAIAQLQRRPQLIVLAACQGAGDSYGMLTALGPRLARAGVGAVVAMQGDVPAALADAFCAALFAELRRDGVIDRAVAAARAGLGPDDPWWLPTLWMSVRDGRLWAQPAAPRADEVGGVRIDPALRAHFLVRRGAEVLPRDLLDDRASDESGYRPFYLRRPEVDDRLAAMARDSGKRMALLLGKPLAGKSRAVLRLLNEDCADTLVFIARPAERLSFDSDWLQVVDEAQARCVFVLNDIEQFEGGHRQAIKAMRAIDHAHVLIVATCNPWRWAQPELSSSLGDIYGEFAQQADQQRGPRQKSTRIEIPSLDRRQHEQMLRRSADLQIDRRNLLVDDTIGSYFFPLNEMLSRYERLQREERDLLVEILRSYKCVAIWRRRHTGDAAVIRDYAERRLVRAYGRAAPIVDREWQRALQELERLGFVKLKHEEQGVKLVIEPAYLNRIIVEQDLRGLPDEERERREEERFAFEILDFYPGIDNYARLIKRVTAPDLPRRIYARLLGLGLEADSHVHTAYLGRAASYAEARELFEGLDAAGRASPHVYNALMLKTRGYDAARAVFDEMCAAGVAPDRLNYNTLIRRAGSQGRALALYEDMLARGIAPDEFTLNFLLGNAEGFREARAIAERCAEQGVAPGRVSYLHLLQKATTFDQGSELIAGMHAAGIEVNEQFYRSVLRKEGGKFPAAWALFEELLARGHSIDPFTYQKLMDRVAEHDLELAWSLNRRAPDYGLGRSPILFTPVIKRSPDFAAAMRVCDELLALGLRPSLNNLNTIMLHARAHEEALAVTELIARHRLRPDVQTFNMLISCAPDFAAALGYAEELRARGLRPQAATVHYMLNRARSFEDASTAYAYGQAAGITPEDKTFVLYMRSARSREEVRHVYTQLRAARIKPTPTIFTSLLGQAESFEAAHELVREQLNAGVRLTERTIAAFARKAHEPAHIQIVYDYMQQANLRLDNRMITALIARGEKLRDDQDVLELLAQSNSGAEQFVYTGLIKGAATFEEGLAILARMRERGLTPDPYAVNELIGKAPSFDAAWYAHSELRELVPPGEVTLYVLMGKASRFDDGYLIFTEAEAHGLQPNEKFFNSLLSRGDGSFEAALQVYGRMQARGFRLDPRALSRLLARAPSFERGWALLNRLHAAGEAVGSGAFRSVLKKASTFAQACSALDQMGGFGLAPDTITFNALLAMAADARDVAEARERMRVAGCAPDVETAALLQGRSATFAEAWASWAELRRENPRLRPSEALLRRLIASVPGVGDLDERRLPAWALRDLPPQLPEAYTLPLAQLALELYGDDQKALSILFEFLIRQELGRHVADAVEAAVERFPDNSYITRPATVLLRQARRPASVARAAALLIAHSSDSQRLLESAVRALEEAPGAWAAAAPTLPAAPAPGAAIGAVYALLARWRREASARALSAGLAAAPAPAPEPLGAALAAVAAARGAAEALPIARAAVAAAPADPAALAAALPLAREAGDAGALADLCLTAALHHAASRALLLDAFGAATELPALAPAHRPVLAALSGDAPGRAVGVLARYLRPRSDQDAVVRAVLALAGGAPEDPAVVHAALHELRSMGRLQEALELTAPLAESAALDADLAVARAELLEALGPRPATLAFVEAAAARFPDDGRLAELLAGLLLDAGRLAEAAAAYRGVGQPRLRTLLRLAEAHERSGDEAGTLAWSRAALALDRWQIESHNRCARVLKERGSLDEAERHYRSALAAPRQLPRQRAKTSNNLALLLVRAGRGYDEAERLLLEALAADPGFIWSRHTLGMLYERLGRTDDATREYEAFIRRRSALSIGAMDDATPLFQRLLALHQAGGPGPA